MRRIGLGLWVLAVLVLTTGFASSEEKKKRRKLELLPLMNKLDLSEEQKDKIADIRAKHRPKVAEARKHLEEAVKAEVHDIEEVLTPAQQTKLHELREEAKAKMEAARKKAKEKKPQ